MTFGCRRVKFSPGDRGGDSWVQFPGSLEKGQHVEEW